MDITEAYLRRQFDRLSKTGDIPSRIAITDEISARARKMGSLGDRKAFRKLGVAVIYISNPDALQR